ncbi:MAG: hypothetical protein ABIA47_04590 [bacterium]
MKMLTRLAQLIIILIPIGLFGYLVYLDIAPGGVFEVRYEVGDMSPYADEILPDDRVTRGQVNQYGEPYVTINEDPVYFAVHAPTTRFDDVEVEVEFYNYEQPIVEFGPRVDVYSQSYDLRPLHNLMIENSEWPRLEEDNTVLLQRQANYESIDEFFNNPPPRSSIASYNYDFNVPYRISGYSPLDAWQTFDVSLRGYHKYVTYLRDEPFTLKATFMDMNRNVGADDVVVRVWNENDELMLEEVVEDDGNRITNQTSSTHDIYLADDGWPEGVYSVELSGTSDIFWRELSTSQRYLTFVNQIYIADDVGYLPSPRPSVFFTNAKHITLETYHADATQSVSFGGDTVDIAKSHEKIFYTVDDSGVVVGATPAGDVKIAGDGKFAFSRTAYFDPDPVRLTALTDLGAVDVDYVLAGYNVPEFDGSWYKASESFALYGIEQTDGSVTFAISAPYISLLQNSVKVHAINLTFTKQPLTWDKFWAEVRERLPFGL